MAQDPANTMRYRPLMPKGAKLLPRRTLHKPISRQECNTSPDTKKCLVPLCQRTDCNLVSHARFNPETARPKTQGRVAESDNTTVLTRVITNHSTGSAKAATVPVGSMVLFYDGLHCLPDFAVENPAYASFRQLFHDFFQSYYDRLELITTPPPVSINEKARVAISAESNDVVFLNIVALTHNLRKTIAAEEHDDLGSHYFHARVTRLLVRKLNESKGMDLENTILIVCTLISLEIMNGNLKHLSVHRRGLDELIKRQGGIHNLTFSLRNTLHMDRVISVYTCTPPYYARPPDNCIRRPRRSLQTHGFYLSCLDNQDLIEPAVVEHCLNLCEVLEDFDAQKVTYDPRVAVVAPTTSNLLYFYFLRDRVGINFCHLNAKYSQENTISRCILLASKILEYPILYSNWIADLPMFLATKLQKLLSDQDLDYEWFGHKPVLIWILFVLVTMPHGWKGHDWALHLLRDQLNVKYGGSMWPTKWVALERAALSNLIWHQATLDQSFHAVCHALAWDPVDWIQTELVD